MKRPNALTAAALAACLALPALARVEDYGHRVYTHVGHGHFDRGPVVYRGGGGGPGWAGVLAGGILGAAAGIALSHAAPAPVVVAPEPGAVVPVLPGACYTVPSYSGAVLYDCGNVYYQPFYEGPSLMYEVVPAP